jgi:type IV pilus assembly protein PilV
MKNRLFYTSRINRGFSLIEVLVALLVLSIGLLGLAMLQATGMKFNSDAYLRTQATYLAYDIIDRIRTNKDVAISDPYVASAPPTGTIPNCDTSLCDTAQLVSYDLDRWYGKLHKVLPRDPNADSSIAKNANEYTITIRWMERELPMEQVWVVEL